MRWIDLNDFFVDLWMIMFRALAAIARRKVFEIKLTLVIHSMTTWLTVKVLVVLLDLAVFANSSPQVILVTTGSRTQSSLICTTFRPQDCILYTFMAEIFVVMLIMQENAIFNQFSIVPIKKYYFALTL